MEKKHKDMCPRPPVAQKHSRSSQNRNSHKLWRCGHRLLTPRLPCGMNHSGAVHGRSTPGTPYPSPNEPTSAHAKWICVWSIDFQPAAHGKPHHVAGVQVQIPIETHGYGSKLNYQGTVGLWVLVHVSVYQGNPCWVPIFDP